MKTESIQSLLEVILASYVKAQTTERLGRESVTFQVFDRVAGRLRQTEPVISRREVRVRWSVGQGCWARIPWIAALDRRETSKTSEGAYVAYLFRADMSGVYLTLTQGTHEVLQARG